MRRDIYQAIADPTRRAILALLTVGAMMPNQWPGISAAPGKGCQGICRCRRIVAMQTRRSAGAKFITS